jgi:drug/metabolite transporter (DMT)-like permease
MNHTYRIGIIYSLLSALFLALMAAFAKKAAADLPISMVLFARFFICLLVMMPIIIFSKQRLWLTNRITGHALRSLFGLTAIACFFYSLQFTPLVNALILSYTIPLFVPFLSYIFYKIKISIVGFFHLIIGFIGVVLILQPESNGWNFASLIALASGLLGAAAMLSIRELSKTEAAVTIMFCYYLFSTIIILLWLFKDIFTRHFSWDITYRTWLMLLGVGIMGTLYQVFLTYSLKFAPAQITTPFLYIGVILSFIIEWAIWGEIPHILTTFGIILATIGAVMSSRTSEKIKNV